MGTDIFTGGPGGNDPPSGQSSGGFMPAINVMEYGAIGDGVTDSTAAFTNAINRLNSVGGTLYIPAGQYMVSSPLPSITRDSASVRGVGWSQTDFTSGSTISAASGLTGAMLTLAGEGVEVNGVNIDGQGRASTLAAITAPNCRLLSMATHGVAANGVCVDGQAGSVSLWMDNCRINGINFPNTGIQLNDTDAIIRGCKPVNNTFNVALLGGASGTILQGNHMTPGAVNGTNSIFINGNPSHVIIDANRFDNYVKAAIQITPPASTPNNIHITNNQFHSTVQTDNTYALIQVDTSASSVRGLHIVGNSGYAGASNRPKNGLSAALQVDGTTATNVTRLASLGCVFNSNNFWVATAMQGFGAPSVARGNMVTLDGATYAAVTDI